MTIGGVEYELVRQLTESARTLVETRCRETMTLANVTADDLKAGRATAERVTERHSRCNGTGVVVTIERSSDRLFGSVQLCECFEVKIVRPLEQFGGDAFIHV